MYVIVHPNSPSVTYIARESGYSKSSSFPSSAYLPTRMLKLELYTAMVGPAFRTHCFQIVSRIPAVHVLNIMPGSASWVILLDTGKDLLVLSLYALEESKKQRLSIFLLIDRAFFHLHRCARTPMYTSVTLQLLLLRLVMF